MFLKQPGETIGSYPRGSMGLLVYFPTTLIDPKKYPTKLSRHRVSYIGPLPWNPIHGTLNGTGVLTCQIEGWFR